LDSALPNHIACLSATVEAWNLPFYGTAQALLKQTIDDMNMKRNTKIYTNYVPIVQSSGTGKSRVVHKLAADVFTIPFNLRETINGQEAPGYPPADQAIRDLFSSDIYLDSGPTGVAAHEKLHIHFSFFFSIIFETVRAEIANWEVWKTPSGTVWVIESFGLHHSDSFDIARVSRLSATERFARLGSTKVGKGSDPDEPSRSRGLVISATMYCFIKLDFLALESAKQLLEFIRSCSVKQIPRKAVAVVLYLDEAQKMADDARNNP
jgi:hypothetical protein